jgi:metal-responsive CopG/Arc/MetJ family transcriptional regulator
MVKKRIVVEIASELLVKLDHFVDQQRFAGRSEFIEAAVVRQMRRLRRDRLAEACLRLDADEERGLAEEGMGSAYLLSDEY